MARRSFNIELHAPRLRSLVSQGLSQLVQRLKDARPWQGSIERLGSEAQRFGGAAWNKIAERWPALADLVRDTRRVRARYQPQPPQPVASPAQASAAADALVAQLMASSAWETRAGAALSLAHHRGDAVVQALLRALRDPAVEVAVAAAEGLAAQIAEQPGDPAIQGLLEVVRNLEGYYSPVTRVAALAALAPHLDAAGIEPIVGAVRDIDAEVSIAAASVVAERLPSAAQTHLLPVLRDGSGYYLPVVRLAIANALERAGLLHAGVALDLLAVEQDPAVRRVLERASHLTGEVVFS